MKITTLAVLLFVAALNVFAQDSEQEKAFISRLEVFQKTNDMNEVPTIIWYDKSPPLFRILTCDNFEVLILRGIKSVKFESVPKVMLEPTTIDGVEYVPNLEPYKMVAIEYQKEIKNGSSGFSMITGMKDGKIIICGLKKK